MYTLKHSLPCLKQFLHKAVKTLDTKKERTGANLWNEIPCSLRELPRSLFKKRIQQILLSIFDDEDSFIDIHKIIFIISRVNYFAFFQNNFF